MAVGVGFPETLWFPSVANTWTASSSVSREVGEFRDSALLGKFFSLTPDFSTKTEALQSLMCLKPELSLCVHLGENSRKFRFQDWIGCPSFTETFPRFTVYLGDMYVSQYIKHGHNIDVF